MWLDYVQNPKAISHLYKSVPPLDSVVVALMQVDPRGPTMRLFLDLQSYADNPPARWEPGCNTVQIELDFIDVKSLKIEGFTVTPVLDFSITSSASGLMVEAKGANMKLLFSCDTIYIQRTTGYINTVQPSRFPDQ